MNPRTLERIDAALEGTLDDGEFLALQDELRSDPSAFDHWCRQAEIHGRLEWELSAAAETVAFPANPARRRSGWHYGAAAALLAAGIGLGLLFSGRTGPDDAGLTGNPAPSVSTHPVARLTGTENAVWSGAGPELGGWVGNGPLELVSGTALLAFDCGASVQLRGPARLHLTSPVRALLERGRATIDIPRQAYGFVFETPSTEISRRMSRFAVVVEDDLQSEIHVLDGQIQLAGKLGDLDTLQLAKDRAVRLDDAGSPLPSTRYEASQLAISLPESAELLPEWYLHWGFEATDTAAGIFHESGPHDRIGPPFAAQVHLPHPDSAVSLVPGRFGNAVRMNGQRGFLATEFPGISGNSPRTVAFWVRIEPDTPDHLAYSFLSWGTRLTPGGKWQLGWNTGNDNPGAIGAIRTEVQNGYHVGSTNLRTGRWHHVVSVFTGGDGADVASHIRHYVDGRLEATTSVRPCFVNTRTAGEDCLPLTIGRRIEADDYYRTFGGELDEVYVFPTALTPEQIERLHRENIAPELRR